MTITSGVNDNIIEQVAKSLFHLTCMAGKNEMLRLHLSREQVFNWRNIRKNVKKGFLIDHVQTW